MITVGSRSAAAEEGQHELCSGYRHPEPDRCQLDPGARQSVASVISDTRPASGHRITGCLAASVTPLSEDGELLDEGAFEPLVDFFVASGLDGILAMGTTGESVLLDVRERSKVVDLFVSAAHGRLKVIIQAGAQTTRQTVEIAAHAATAGADGVAVISPPYFALDDRSILQHLVAAGEACAPLPFYIYEFAARSGYPVPVGVIAELRQRLPNLTGLKVSDAPWAQFEPYLIEGLDVFVGPEALIHQGISRGAVGAVSALASALPELVIDAVRARTEEATERCVWARGLVQGFPFHSALKLVLAQRGIPVTRGVRAPLRSLDRSEMEKFDIVAREMLAKLDLSREVGSGRSRPATA